MMTMRPADERGRASLGWLDSRHTFSFGQYYDPRFLGFGPLRVINEDRVQPGRGFDTHGHRDMEIVSYVLDGALAHEDSMGNGSVIRPGDVQRMSAGTGVRHSEYNASASDPVHFLQIWIIPERDGIEPSYEQKTFSPDDKRGRFRLLGSRDGRDGSVTIHRDVDLYGAVIGPGENLEYRARRGRRIWVQLAGGSVTLGDTPLEAGDGIAIEDVETLQVTGHAADTELLLFDMD
jgi:redox-sensitive bicupin YhaK (pirin superfamily)